MEHFEMNIPGMNLKLAIFFLYMAISAHGQSVSVTFSTGFDSNKYVLNQPWTMTCTFSGITFNTARVSKGVVGQVYRFDGTTDNGSKTGTGSVSGSTLTIDFSSFESDDNVVWTCTIDDGMGSASGTVDLSAETQATQPSAAEVTASLSVDCISNLQAFAASVNSDVPESITVKDASGNTVACTSDTADTTGRTCVVSVGEVKGYTVQASLFAVDSSTKELGEDNPYFGPIIGISVVDIIISIIIILQATICCMNKQETKICKNFCCLGRSCWMASVTIWFILQYVFGLTLIILLAVAAGHGSGESCTSNGFSSSLGAASIALACIALAVWIICCIVFFFTFDHSEKSGGKQCLAVLLLFGFIIIMPVLAIVEVVLRCCSEDKSQLKLIFGKFKEDNGDPPGTVENQGNNLPLRRN